MYSVDGADDVGGVVILERIRVAWLKVVRVDAGCCEIGQGSGHCSLTGCVCACTRSGPGGERTYQGLQGKQKVGDCAECVVYLGGTSHPDMVLLLRSKTWAPRTWMPNLQARGGFERGEMSGRTRSRRGFAISAETCLCIRVDEEVDCAARCDERRSLIRKQKV